MTTRHFTIACFVFTVAAALGACRKNQQDSEEPGGRHHGAINLCSAYPDCNSCIAGQQERGNTLGEAETECGLAVTGCWTTWDKPVHCGGNTYHERPNQ